MWRLLRLRRDRQPDRVEIPGSREERREAPRVATRRRLRVSFNLSFLDPRMSLGSEASAAMLEGHTYDISATGAALLVSSLSVAGRDLTKAGQSFLVEIELPSGPLRFQATAAQHEPLNTEGEEGYVFGVRITEISESRAVNGS